MKRRDFLASAGMAVGLSVLPASWLRADESKPARLLYFTRSAGFEHSAVKPEADGLSISDKVLIELGKKHNIEVVCTKDGRVFDEELDKFDAVAFYTSGDLCSPKSKRNTPPMSRDGKKKLLDAIAAGKGFIGFHSATDSFHSPGSRDQNQPIEQRDPYIRMIGGEFIRHGAQQETDLIVTSPEFPGVKGLDKRIRLLEEWYALKNFAPDLHVVLLQETKGMKGPMYERPPYPSTWARLHGEGRVFYTSLGHRHDIWTNPLVQQIIVGALNWILRRVDVEVKPNLSEVAPGANELGK